MLRVVQYSRATGSRRDPPRVPQRLLSCFMKLRCASILRSNAKGPAETLELLSGAPLCSEPQDPAVTLTKDRRERTPSLGL